MKIYNMNEYFSDIILQRGLNYYKKGKIISASKINNNTYVFDVAGSVDYCVKIKVHNDEYEMSCNCPYGDNCKHMAACLYYLKFNDIANIDYNKHKKVKAKLTSLDKFKLEVKQMVKECYGKEGYIDYYSGEEFVAGIANCADDIKSTLETDNIDNILDKIFYLYDTIENVEMDGSNGEHAMAESEVNSVLGLVFLKNPKKTKARLLKYFKQEKYIVDLYDVVADFYDVIRTKTEAQIYLDFISDLLKLNSKYITDKLYISYIYIRVYYEFIDEDTALELAEKSLETQYNSYLEKFLVEKYTVLKKYDKAITLLEKNYSNFTDNELLLKLYLKNKDLNKYKKLLLTLYDKTPNYDYYMRIKKHFSNTDFQKINKELLSKMKNSQYYFKDYIKLCDEINDIDGLFVACKEYGLEYLSKYLNKIVKKHRSEAIKIYKEEVKKLCDEARNRARYENVVYYLMRLLDIPKAEKDVLEIIEYVHQNYSSRSVFLEELEFVKSHI